MYRVIWHVYHNFARHRRKVKARIHLHMDFDKICRKMRGKKRHVAIVFFIM